MMETPAYHTGRVNDLLGSFQKQSDLYLIYHPDNNVPPGPRDRGTVFKCTKHDCGSQNQRSRAKKSDYLDVLTTRKGKCCQHDKWGGEQEGAGDNISWSYVRL